LALPLKLLVDECILDKLLDAKLRAAGHDVLTAAEAGLIRKPDHAVFEAAIAADRLALTLNCADFVDLAEAKLAKSGSHPGILLVYRYNMPEKEMSHDDIVRAIANLEATGLKLKDGCHKLNDYNYPAVD
jgi:predicted nuclease of predicted toxin-antitoxin system